ncbi:NADPH-dependent oxidoreductase [Natronospirillum operosum]|uniref:NADPH-dependent oxidoreductase n=1 Tax=Natronospirillum operosum TaxID=2759953 RepID=A0A4Z0W1W4_9GAMM|nr:NAD(P)H-dependent oxidoreductase [Natronospirillum operosum]TGG90623.1 NADPH-dependent oxidoreductase [Natronospirillum operosum]
MNSTTHIGVIIGSAREGRLGSSVAGWVGQELDKRSDLTWSLIDPLEFDLPASMAEESEALCQHLRVADAFLVVVPEYNHSFPAVLKQLIDYGYYEWQAKPVGFVSYGARSGGIRAVEQLRPVFSELHAITVRDAVALPNVWDLFDANGALIEPEGPTQALGRVFAQLAWWATASRLAGNETPYSQVA